MINTYIIIIYHGVCSTELSVLPAAPVCFLDQFVVLHCDGAEHVSAWIYNQSMLQRRDPRLIPTNNGFHLEVKCVLELNNSVFSCLDSYEGAKWESAPVNLRIQG